MSLLVPFGREQRPAGGEPDDAEALRRGLAGDRDALGAIVRREYEGVFRLLVKLSGDRELAADLAQETFLRAFSALNTFQIGRPLRPWLAKIADNLFKGHLRARKHEAVGEGALAYASAGEGALDPAIAQLADATVLGAALEQLPENQRRAIALRYYEDLPYEGIAQRLGVPVGTAKTWLFRGRERLRELLEQQGAGR